MLRKGSFIRKPFEKNKKCRTEIFVKLLDISTSVGSQITSVSFVVGTKPNKTAAVRGNVQVTEDLLVPEDDFALKFRTFVYQSDLAFESKEQRVNVLYHDSENSYFCIPLHEIVDSPHSPLEFTLDLITSEGTIKSAVRVVASCRLQAELQPADVIVIDGESDDENEIAENRMPEKVDQASVWTLLGKERASFIVKNTEGSDDDEYSKQPLDQEWTELGKQKVVFSQFQASPEEDYMGESLSVDDEWKLENHRVTFIHKNYESSDDDESNKKTLDQGSEWTTLGKQKSSFMVKKSVESDDEQILEPEIEQW